ncbi:MAG TPA: hypothetical protein VJI13_05590 [Candidatus Norongarragalinales archaeon]|nr:hypothetical protein [Candidatus Norongarragalinales archaeon]
MSRRPIPSEIRSYLRQELAESRQLLDRLGFSRQIRNKFIKKYSNRLNRAYLLGRKHHPANLTGSALASWVEREKEIEIMEMKNTQKAHLVRIFGLEPFRTNRNEVLRAAKAHNAMLQKYYLQGLLDFWNEKPRGKHPQ